MSEVNENNRVEIEIPAIETSLKNDLLGLKESILKIVSDFPEIHTPLHDSTRDVPRATRHLDSVTEQTEEAANKVLGDVEEIASSLSDIIGNANEALNEIRDNNVGCKKAITCLEKIDELANHCQNSSYTIMETLQFQDITAQQISHAAHLLEGVESKLTNIIGQLFKDETNPLPANAENPGSTKKYRAYNPDAHMTDLKSSQDEIDDLIKQNAEKKT